MLTSKVRTAGRKSSLALILTITDGIIFPALRSCCGGLTISSMRSTVIAVISRAKRNGPVFYNPQERALEKNEDD